MYATVPDAGVDRDAGDAGCEAIDRARARFAVIGDFGEASDREEGVARVVADWEPDFILTTGDNNYVFGEAETIDENVGQYFHDWIHPYAGEYGDGHACDNRFFPTLGNADWDVTNADMELPEPYLDYFALPGNERYYDVRLGPVHFFALDADEREPDGVLWTSMQGDWLVDALARSDAPYRVVAMHHSPLASGDVRGPHGHMQWPFRSWGASVVLSGHDHIYERLHHDGLVHVVEGLGGRERRDGLDVPMVGSETFFSDDYGAVLADVDESAMHLAFVTQDGVQMDEVRIPAGDVFLDESLVPEGSTWRYLADGSNPPGRWNAPDFDDSAWPAGAGQLGAGDDDEATVLPDPDVDVAYFRTTFDVPDPSRFVSLELRVLADDGAVAWVNGIEVLRSNVPAVDAIGGPSESAFAAAALDPALLVAGVNSIAVEVHAADPTGGDVSFESVLTGRSADPILGLGSDWRYLDDGSDPGDEWAEPDFDDSTWLSGAAPIGYGDSVATTTAPVAVVYARRTFEWSGGTPDAMWLRLRRDDGAVVTLNGREIWRGGVAADARAPFAVPDALEAAFVETWVDPALLADGWNVVAVEVHGAVEETEDLSFDLELDAS